MTQDVRKLIVEEMLEKEEGYIAVLKCLSTVSPFPSPKPLLDGIPSHLLPFQKFREPLEEMQKSNKRFEKDYLTKSDLRMMFHKLPELLASHVKVRDELQQVMRKWDPKRSAVGKIFIAAAKSWADIYPSYIDLQYDALSALDRCESRPRFNSFIEVR